MDSPATVGWCNGDAAGIECSSAFESGIGNGAGIERRGGIESPRRGYRDGVLSWKAPPHPRALDAASFQVTASFQRSYSLNELYMKLYLFIE